MVCEFVARPDTSHGALGPFAERTAVDAQPAGSPAQVLMTSKKWAGTPSVELRFSTHNCLLN